MIKTDDKILQNVYDILKKHGYKKDNPNISWYLAEFVKTFDNHISAYKEEHKMEERLKKIGFRRKEHKWAHKNVRVMSYSCEYDDDDRPILTFSIWTVKPGTDYK